MTIAKLLGFWIAVIVLTAFYVFLTSIFSFQTVVIFLLVLMHCNMAARIL